jgi:Cytochrome c554 and c-prime
MAGVCSSSRMAGILAFLALSSAWLGGVQGPMNAGFPRENWQPTRAAPGAGYVGTKVCARCHALEAATQPLTDMAHSLERVAECQVLQGHPQLEARLGRYSYSIETKGGSATYSVSDGKSSLSARLLYTFGVGHAGQTYVYERAGEFFESRVSYFNDINGLDLTLGQSSDDPPDLETALGRPVEGAAAVQCFACHSTDAAGDGSLHLDDLIPGVTCEGCHGPGADHVAAIKAGRLASAAIFNPGTLAPSDLVDFCASCHRGAADVLTLRLRGPITVRFQPYRLVLSRCYGTGSGTLSCLTCHDPHQNVRHDEGYYDSKCLSCHPASGATRPDTGTRRVSCPVESRNCVACHMPKVELPGGHAQFTDHDIRIVREASRKMR